MADKKKIHPANRPGNLFVDTSCIDCGTCYWIAPDVFKRHEGNSIVYQAPDESRQLSAWQAMYSCPTNSIGVKSREKSMGKGLESLPRELVTDVLHLGFHARGSFGAASYLLRGSKGNLMIDSPRFSQHLVKKLEALGGVKAQYLTHRDDIADTERYLQALGHQAWIHALDQPREMSFLGKWEFEGECLDISEELKVIAVPGHTQGSVCFLFRDKYLFTGDHLAFSTELGHLYAFRRACWFDFEIQIESMKRLLDYSFEAVFPGHGAPMISDSKSVRKSLELCIDCMEREK